MSVGFHRVPFDPASLMYSWLRHEKRLYSGEASLKLAAGFIHSTAFSLSLGQLAASLPRLLPERGRVGGVFGQVKGKFLLLRGKNFP